MTNISRILLLILLLLTTLAYTIDMECLLAPAGDSFCAGEARRKTICLCSSPSIPQQKFITIQYFLHYNNAALLTISSLLPESNEKVHEKPSIPYLKIDSNSTTIPRAPPIA